MSAQRAQAASAAATSPSDRSPVARDVDVHVDAPYVVLTITAPVVDQHLELYLRPDDALRLSARLSAAWAALDDVGQAP